MKVSKNISKGKRIKDLREIHKLALDKKSVVITRPSHAGHDGLYYQVRPAAFILGWPLKIIVDWQFFYSIKHETKNNRK